MHSIGYQVFDIGISPTDLNIPQNRERVIFIVIRNDLYSIDSQDAFLAKLEENKRMYFQKNKDFVIFEKNPNPKYNLPLEIKNVLFAWDQFIRIFAKNWRYH